MPVFDFSNATTEKKDPECTYTTFRSNETKPSPEKPILVLDNTSRQWNHHSCGVFSNPNQKSSNGLVKTISVYDYQDRILEKAMQSTRSERPHSEAAPSFLQRMDFFSL